MKAKRPKVGTKVSVAGSPGGKVYKARVVWRPGKTDRQDDVEGFAIYVRLTNQTFFERMQHEGNSWCCGWTGPAVDALKAATALAEDQQF